MVTSLLIMLREGLEIALIVAIVLAYLRQTDRRELFRPVWAGTAGAAAVCVVAGTLFFNMVGSFTGRTEQFVEGALALSAAGVLTWMIFWMRSHARGLSGKLHADVDAAAARSQRALVLVTFIAVAREGFEAVLFLLGAKVGGTSGLPVVTGGLIGLAVACAIAYGVYQGSHRVSLQRFFQVTGGLLILFAAGLFGKGIHELRELFEVEGALAVPLWHIRDGLFAHGWFADFLAGMFGWSRDAERVRVAAYFVYLTPIAYLYFFQGRRPGRGRAAQPDQRAVAV